MRKREAIRPNLAKLATRGGRGVDFFAAVVVKTLSRLSGLFYLFWLFCSEQAGQEGRLPRPVVIVDVHILSGLSGLFYLFYLFCSEQASSRIREKANQSILAKPSRGGGGMFFSSAIAMGFLSGLSSLFYLF